ncbi:MAG: pilin [bacterium]
MTIKRLAQSLLIMISLFLIMPELALSKDSLPPEMNPLCWREAECQEARDRFDPNTSAKKGQGWVLNQSICPGTGWGLCLPAGKTKTSIVIGGKSEFVDIGDYIMKVYKYAITVAGILSVAVIIVAGLQWLTSGGNSDTITRSKKRLFGALVGLFIAYASYFILNQINPAFVNLRLPQAWLVKPKEAISTFCVSQPTSTASGVPTKFTFVADYTDQKKPVSPPKDSSAFNLQYLTEGKPADIEASKKKFYCGHRFFSTYGGTQVCYGDYCPNTKDGKPDPSGQQNLCVDNFDKTYPLKDYICRPMTIAGRVLCVPGAACVAEGWEIPDMSNYKQLWALCKDGCGNQVYTKDETQDQPTYQTFGLVANYKDFSVNYKPDDTVIKTSSGYSAVMACSKHGGLAGFVMKFEMDQQGVPTDEDHYIGRDPANKKQSVDLGDEAVFRGLQAAYNPLLYRGCGMNWNKNIDEKYLFSQNEIETGVGGFEVRADKICNIPSFSGMDEKRKKCYDKYLKKP